MIDGRRFMDSSWPNFNPKVTVYIGDNPPQANGERLDKGAPMTDDLTTAQRHDSHEWNVGHSMIGGFHVSCDNCMVEDGRPGYDQPCQPFDPLIYEAERSAGEKLNGLRFSGGWTHETFDARWRRETVRSYGELVKADADRRVREAVEACAVVAPLQWKRTAGVSPRLLLSDTVESWTLSR